MDIAAVAAGDKAEAREAAVDKAEAREAAVGKAEAEEGAVELDPAENVFAPNVGRPRSMKEAYPVLK